LPESVPAPRVRFSDECKVQSPGEGVGVDSCFSVLDVVQGQPVGAVQEEEEVGGDGEAAESVQEVSQTPDCPPRMREYVVNAVLKVKDHPKRNREFRVNTVLRTRKPKTYSGGYRRVTTAVPKVEGDNITFVSGCLTKDGTPGWMQVDPGSDISCVLAEYVASLGMQHQMVKRGPRDTVRVRGIGTAEGEGEVVTMSWRVKESRRRMGDGVSHTSGGRGGGHHCGGVVCRS
jgi:hypothetical protein